MIEFKPVHNIKKNNDGAALITTIIIIFFISILATVILYIAGVNFRMKKADYRTKVSFYINEQPLEMMQSNLVIPVCESLNEAYAYTNSNYAYLGSERKKAFRDKMFEALRSRVITPYGDNIKTLVSSLTGVSSTNIIIPSDYSYTGDPDLFADFMFTSHNSVFSDNEQYVIVPYDDIYVATSSDLSFIDLPWTPSTPDNDVKILFKKITVVTINEGFRSVINTNIAVSVPSLDWSGGAMPVLNSVKSYTVNDLIHYDSWNNE
jgi:hypothetical protein